MTQPPLRIGTLGAARITPMALVRPAGAVTEAAVVAVAARDRRRAEEFAAKHSIERVHDSYEALIADPEIDAVYNPLPNAWRSKPASTCCARSRSRRTRSRPARWPTQRGEPVWW
jgi:predicted dehydrogenase